MKKAVWWFAVLALLAVSFSFVGCAKQEEKKPATAPAPEKAVAPAAARENAQSLFIIERNKNANVVHYDARLTADGKLDPKEPVIAYWVMVAEDGRKEQLNWIEKKEAYGFTVKPDASVKGYQMTLKAAPGKPITVREEKDAVRAEAVIAGRPATLEKMYINATDGPTGPKVQYIDVYGKDMTTGEKRHEKMVPKK